MSKRDSKSPKRGQHFRVLSIEEFLKSIASATFLSKWKKARNRSAFLRETVSERVLFETLEQRVLLSADLLPIQGSIDVPGEVDQYTFTVADPKRIYFDAETNDSQMQWSLIGPRGTEIGTRSFTGSDAGAFSSGSPVLDVVSGDYTLSIKGGGDHTGSYQFRLIDLANATGITAGSTVSGSL